MRFQSLWLALCLTQLTTALVTLSTIRNLTAVTDECREKIELKTDWVNRNMEGFLRGEKHVKRLAQDQITLGGEEEISSGRSREEVEDVSFSSCLRSTRLFPIVLMKTDTWIDHSSSGK